MSSWTVKGLKLLNSISDIIQKLGYMRDILGLKTYLITPSTKQ